MVMASRSILPTCQHRFSRIDRSQHQQCSVYQEQADHHVVALTVDGTTIKPATATNDVETTAALKTKQVYADAVTLTGATVTPDFKDGNCFILSGAITTVNAPTPVR